MKFVINAAFFFITSAFLVFGFATNLRADQIYCSYKTMSNIGEGWWSPASGGFQLEFDEWLVTNTNLVCPNLLDNMVNPGTITFICLLDGGSKRRLFVDRYTGDFTETTRHKNGTMWMVNGVCEKQNKKF
jgi:hypothetical protein